jgi:hypothetical protein
MPRSLKKISEKISSGTQKLFLTIWWYAVEKRLVTPGLHYTTIIINCNYAVANGQFDAYK